MAQLVSELMQDKDPEAEMGVVLCGCVEGKGGSMAQLVSEHSCRKGAILQEDVYIIQPM